jgi:hypothetical protein
MSFDLAVWYPEKRISDEEARELYVRLCDSDTSGVVAHPAVDAFYAELTAKHPEIDTIPEERIDDHEYCPWSCRLERSPSHVITCCVWPKATYVGQLVESLARKHGLAVYDPQSDRVTYPDGSTGGSPTGIGRGARLTLGSFALLFAAIFVYSEQNAPSSAPLLVYVLAGFCMLITVACFSRTLRGPAVRIIGFMVFLAYAAYLAYELLREPAKPYGGRSEPHWLNAMLGLIVFGLPGLYVAVRGKYPKWGKGAKAFNSRTVSPADQESDSYGGITVETEMFEHREVKPHFINPCCFGEDFAAWLKKQIAALEGFGFRFSEIIQEDYGWGFWAWHGKDPFWVALSYVGDGPQEPPAQWVISVSYDPGLNLLKRLFHRPNCQALQQLRDQVRQAVASNAATKIVSLPQYGQRWGVRPAR